MYICIFKVFNHINKKMIQSLQIAVIYIIKILFK